MWGRTSIVAICLGTTCLVSIGQADDATDKAANEGEPGVDRGMTTNVALVDLAHVFANSDAFNAGKSALKQRLKTLDAQGRTMARIVADLEKSITDADEGSLERDRRERDALEAKRRLEDFRRTAKGDLVRSEAALYRNEYARVRRAIRVYARENGIALVLRYQRVDLDDTSDPKKIIQAVNRGVLYTDETLDVTDDILQRINDEHARVSDE